LKQLAINRFRSRIVVIIFVSEGKKCSGIEKNLQDLIICR